MRHGAVHHRSQTHSKTFQNLSLIYRIGPRPPSGSFCRIVLVKWCSNCGNSSHGNGFFPPSRGIVLRHGHSRPVGSFSPRPWGGGWLLATLAMVACSWGEFLRVFDILGRLWPLNFLFGGVVLVLVTAGLGLAKKSMRGRPLLFWGPTLCQSEFFCLESEALWGFGIIPSLWFGAG